MRNGVVDPLFGPTPCHHVHQPSKSVQFMSEDQSSSLFLARPDTFGGWGSSTSSNEQQMLRLPCPIVSALKVLDKQRWFSRPVSDTEFRLLFGRNLLPLLGSVSQSEVWRGGLRDLVKKKHPLVLQLFTNYLDTKHSFKFEWEILIAGKNGRFLFYIFLNNFF